MQNIIILIIGIFCYILFLCYLIIRLNKKPSITYEQYNGGKYLYPISLDEKIENNYDNDSDNTCLY